jgi:hypothetical protein
MGSPQIRSRAQALLALAACRRAVAVYDFLFGRLVLKRDTLKETDPDSLGSSTSTRSAIGERCFYRLLITMS